eukprot:2631967-Rhodomonas_salina.1
MGGAEKRAAGGSRGVEGRERRRGEEGRGWWGGGQRMPWEEEGGACGTEKWRLGRCLEGERLS